MKKENGFTLIETLVAISVLLLTIMVPMTIAARGLQTAFHAREQLTATFLAQEGVEMVRFRRDKMALANLDQNTASKMRWIASGGTFPAACTTACAIDWAFAHGACTGEVCRLYSADAPTDGLLYDYGRATQLGWSASPFYRSLKIIKSPDAQLFDQSEIEVRVWWRSGLFGGTKEVVLRAALLDRYLDYVVTP